MNLLISDNGAADILPEIDGGRLDLFYDPPVAEDDLLRHDDRVYRREDRVYRDSSDTYVIGDRFEAFRWAIQASAPSPR
jgi:hypothetical protein